MCNGILKIFEKCKGLCFPSMAKGKGACVMGGGGGCAAATPVHGSHQYNFNSIKRVF